MSATERLGLDASATASVRGGASAAQQQTSDTFAYKWRRRETYDSPRVQAHSRQWMLERYCEGDPSRLDAWLADGPRILLDAGCGSGYSALLLFGERLRDHDYLGVDISDAVDVARERFREASIPGEFLQCDLMDLPVPDGSVDLVFSEGVLHHTDSVEKAVAYLARKLVPGGRFLFYVYARKGPVREFTDDFVRERLRNLSDEEAWKALEPLTRLGVALGELGAEVEVPEDVPLLGIPKGRYDVQRLFYYYVVKAFYRPDFTLEEMTHVNFDWFRPLNCHRHTPEEVRTFCEQAGLAIERLAAEPAGITVVARKA